MDSRSGRDLGAGLRYGASLVGGQRSPGVRAIGDRSDRLHRLGRGGVVRGSGGGRIRAQDGTMEVAAAGCRMGSVRGIVGVLPTAASGRGWRAVSRFGSGTLPCGVREPGVLFRGGDAGRFNCRGLSPSLAQRLPVLRPDWSRCADSATTAVGRLAAYAAIAGWAVRLCAQAAAGFGSLLRARGAFWAFDACFILAGTVLPLALVHSWGRVFPRWVPLLGGRRTPRWLLLGPAFGIGGALTVYFGVSIFAFAIATLTGSWNRSASSAAGVLLGSDARLSDVGSWTGRGRDCLLPGHASEVPDMRPVAGQPVPCPGCGADEPASIQMFTSTVTESPAFTTPRSGAASALNRMGTAARGRRAAAKGRKGSKSPPPSPSRTAALLR